jgi:hypothetical protein
MLGGVIVFRSWNGKTYMSNRPKKPTKESEGQKENRNKFRMATAYAKSMMSDPARKLEYQEKAKKLNLPNAYTAAITDYMRKPEIKEVSVVTEVDKATEITMVVEKRGFEVDGVEIKVVDNEGNTIQAGAAKNIGGSSWAFKLTKDENIARASKVVISTNAKRGVVVKEILLVN